MIRVPGGGPPRGAALVTLILGDDFRSFWERHAREGWERYARAHGYDLIAFTGPLDASERAAGRSPSWQKCLVPSHPACRDYARLVWVDADVLINAARAPCLVSAVPPERVGGTDAYAFFSRGLHDYLYEEYVALRRAQGHEPVVCPEPRDYYRAFGLEVDGVPGLDAVLQCGVLALSPARHAEVLSACYRRHEERRDPRSGYRYNYEMRPLSYELVRGGLHHFVDPRFNLILSNFVYLAAPYLFHGEVPPETRRRWQRQVVTSAYAHAYFLHLAGGAEWLGYAEHLAPGVERPTDFGRLALD